MRGMMNGLDDERGVLRLRNVNGMLSGGYGNGW